MNTQKPLNEQHKVIIYFNREQDAKFAYDWITGAAKVGAPPGVEIPTHVALVLESK